MQSTLSATPGSLAVTPRTDRRALFVALALGVAAAFFTLVYLRGISARTEGTGPTLAVVVAGRDIPIGQKITDAMIEVKTLPEAALVTGAATSKEQVVGMT